MNDTLEYAAARRKVIWRTILRASFFFDLIFFLLILATLLLNWPANPDNIMGTLFFFFIMGSFLLVHGMVAFNWLGRWLDRATQRELGRGQPSEKAKRTHLELGEDGELVEVDDRWLVEAEEQKKHHA
jgi:uncharacterized membrane protein YdjX (TVP38/TMEM64 family)